MGNWRVPGTSPLGQNSWDGAADGGDEPWFAEAVSTVSLDLEKAGETMMAFTKEAATFKIASFCEEKGIEDQDKAFNDLVGALGYDKFWNPIISSWQKPTPNSTPNLRKRRRPRKQTRKQQRSKDLNSTTPTIQSMKTSFLLVRDYTTPTLSCRNLPCSVRM